MPEITLSESVEPITLTLHAGGHPLLLPPQIQFSAIEGTNFGSILHPVNAPYLLEGGSTLTTRFEVRESPAEVLAALRAAQQRVQAAMDRAHAEIMKRKQEARMRHRVPQVPFPDDIDLLGEDVGVPTACVHPSSFLRGNF